MRFLGAWEDEAVDWEEFVKRGDERRSYRRHPQKTDFVTVLIGALIFACVVVWVVWGIRS